MRPVNKKIKTHVIVLNEGFWHHGMNEGHWIQPQQWMHVIDPCCRGLKEGVGFQCACLTSAGRMRTRMRAHTSVRDILACARTWRMQGVTKPRRLGVNEGM